MLLLLTLLGGGVAHNPEAASGVLAASLQALPVRSALADDLIPRAYLPLVAKPPPGCEPISGVQYSTLTIEEEPTDRPAEEHADLNLALRGYEPTDADRGLVDVGGNADALAPKLNTLFGDQRVPVFPAVYRVYDWDWDCNCRGDLLAQPEVTLAGMGTAASEKLYLPDSGYDIGSGYEALVLYASEERITLKYTREDNVISGYTLHIENVCVEPRLLALYRSSNEAGRLRLPALRAGQPFGRARGGEIGVAIRDSGTFLDPRAKKDWW